MKKKSKSQDKVKQSREGKFADKMKQKHASMQESIRSDRPSKGYFGS